MVFRLSVSSCSSVTGVSGARACRSPPASAAANFSSRAMGVWMAWDRERCARIANRMVTASSASRITSTTFSVACKLSLASAAALISASAYSASMSATSEDTLRTSSSSASLSAMGCSVRISSPMRSM